MIRATMATSAVMGMAIADQQCWVNKTFSQLTIIVAAAAEQGSRPSPCRCGIGGLMLRVSQPYRSDDSVYPNLVSCDRHSGRQASYLLRCDSPTPKVGFEFDDVRPPMSRGPYSNGGS